MGSGGQLHARIYWLSGRLGPSGSLHRPMARAPRADLREASDESIKLVTQLDARVQNLESIRYSWWIHWRQLADYLLPRRMRWLYPCNQTWNRGAPLNQNIINNTGTIAARTLAAGMLAGTTSPAKPWFRLAPTDATVGEDYDVKVWLEEARNRMMRIMAASNYYTCKGVQLFDEVVFGTSPMMIYEDADKGIHCYVPSPGEYFCSANGNFEVDSLYRRYPLSVSQVVSTFGLDALPEDSRHMVFHAGTALKDGRTVATGGRVLAVTARGDSLAEAQAEARFLMLSANSILTLKKDRSSGSKVRCPQIALNQKKS